MGYDQRIQKVLNKESRAQPPQNTDSEGMRGSPQRGTSGKGPIRTEILGCDPIPHPVLDDNNVYDCTVSDKFLNKISEPYDKENKSVVNLSDYKLSNSEVSLLEKGLSFCPTPGEPDMGQLKRDLDTFHRNLRIKTFFDPSKGELRGDKDTSSEGDNNDTSDFDTHIRHSKVLKPSKKWSPPMGPLHLESFILTNERDLNKTFPKAPNFHNLTKEEKKGIGKLTSNKGIVIKPADKGGATVILNREDYTAEGHRQLADGDFYQKLTSDHTEGNSRRIEYFIDTLHGNGEITKSIKKRLQTLDPKTPELYLLPKIHKEKRPPPGRPVVSANNCPTEKISALADIFLKPHLPKIKSYIKDTTDFIQKLEALPRLTEKTILCTLDVSSLYTNIPNLEGRIAVARFLRKHRNLGQVAEPSNTSICQMLNMILTMNNFRFDGDNYLQIAGTAMGTRVAPTYANIFMSDFEDKFVYSYQRQPLFWGRFIDDIFFIWEHGEEELIKFIHHLNRVHKTIKFTHEYSHTKVNFLDVWAIKTSDGYIKTDLYTKPTDSNNYLHFYSAHPGHCKRGIPLGQFLRLRRICSDDEAFLGHSIAKARHLLRRRYPKDVITQAFQKAWKTRRHELLHKKTNQKEEQDTNILVTTFNPGFRALRDLVTDNWDILGRSCSTRKIFEKGLLTAHRRPKSLRDLLVRAKIPQDKPDTGGTEPWNPCNTRTCRYCPRLNKTGRITCKASGREYVAKHNVTCKSSNVIYCITCKCCGIQYVGQTKNRLMDRFQAHFYNILYNKPKSEIGKHFNFPDHKGLDDVEIHIVDFIHAHPLSPRSRHLRDLIEFNWIQRMHSNAPLGLNTMDLLVQGLGP